MTGLARILPDGKSTIAASLKRLEEAGYIKWIKKRDENGRFVTMLTIYDKKVVPLLKNGDGDTETENQEPPFETGSAVAENQEESQTIDFKFFIKDSYSQSIKADTKIDTTDNDGYEKVKKIIAEKIGLEDLLKVASKKSHFEVSMVEEIYDLICQMVHVPRAYVKIRGVNVPWKLVKEQYLKLTYDRVANILNRILDENLKIKNMSGYLVTALYEETMSGTLAAQSAIADEDFLYYRGTPY